MSQSERKLADSHGRVAIFSADKKLEEEPAWNTSQIVLSNQRLIISSKADNRTIPLTRISSVERRGISSPEERDVTAYLRITLEDDVLFVAMEGIEAFEHLLYQALINGQTLAVRQSTSAEITDGTGHWVEGRVKLDDDTVSIALISGSLIDIELDVVCDIETRQRPGVDTRSAVVEVQFTTEEKPVETAIAGSPRLIDLLASLLESRMGDAADSLELGELEREVLIALYTDVPPFEVPESVDAPVDTVEETYNRLTEAGILDEIRIRREVELTGRGRELVRDVMDEP